MPKALIHQQFLNLNNNDVIALSIPSSATAYVSPPIQVSRSNGYAGLVVNFISGTALMNISYQLSLDKINWFTAATTDGTTLTTVGAIASSITASQYIVFTPRPAEWLRFSVSMTSTGTWTMQYLHQENGY